MALDSGTAGSVTTSYRNRFREGYTRSYEQEQSDLQPYFEMESQASEFDYYDRLGIADDMTEDTTRYGDNPTSEIEHDRRRIGLRDFELGKHIDPKDLVRVVSDPKNGYSSGFLASGNRKKDDIIIERYFGTSYRGKKGETSVSFVAKPTSGKISIGALNDGQRNKIKILGIKIRRPTCYHFTRRIF